MLYKYNTIISNIPKILNIHLLEDYILQVDPLGGIERCRGVYLSRTPVDILPVFEPEVTLSLMLYKYNTIISNIPKILNIHLLEDYILQVDPLGGIERCRGVYLSRISRRYTPRL